MTTPTPPPVHGLLPTAHTYGLPSDVHLCDTCGALVGDRENHDEWHERTALPDNDGA